MTPLLQIRNVSKRFPGVQALEQVSLSLQAGEVLAIVGENGAGKSTLMKILAGIYQPDDGDIILDGQPVRFANVADALRHGVSLIHQELNLAESLTVTANLFLGHEELWGGCLRLLDNRRMTRDARVLMDRVGLDCDPGSTVVRLSPGQRQLVEIAHALALSSRIVIMDEPTSSLTQRETDRLFEVVRQLKQSGVAVVYISHRLAEVKEIADRVVVLRDGRFAGELPRDQVTHDALVRLMVGRELGEFFHKRQQFAATGPVRLQVDELCFEGGSTVPISFQVRGGEIVTLAGLVGAGRTEVAEALFGIRRVLAGRVLLDGQPITVRHPRDAMAAGLVLVPEDRRYHGLILDDSIQRNIGLPNLDRLSVLRLVLGGLEAELARAGCERLRVRTLDVSQTVGLLSGGNQQKVVLAKWLARKPTVIILDEPTRGIDVGAKSEIYALMDRLAQEGVAIVMISSDLEEVLGISDRVLVLHQGRLTGELSRAQLSQEAIMRLATGAAP